MPGDEDGFTLVELMVVVVIIALLMALAIPIFLALRNRAEDTVAKTSVTLGIRVAKALVDDDTYAPATLLAMTSAEPSLTFVDGSTASTGPSVVSQDSPDPANLTFVVSAYSKTGTCFFVMDDLTLGTSFGSLSGPPTDCVADNHTLVVFGSSW